MNLSTFTLGDLQTNCYLLDNNQEAMIIDPSDDGDFLNEELSRNNLQLKAVVLTHGHFDHCLGLLSLAVSWPQLKIMLHPKDNFLLAQAHDSALHWLGRNADPVPKANQELSDGQKIKLGSEALEVIHTPGHTPGSICLLSDKQENGERYLFSGDTLFANGVGRTDFSYSSHQDLLNSLAKLKKLKQDNQYSLVLAGHGESFY
jgi:glyoxylase-like metal-dependent hydrolase (beta-lactamase superfamily II)